MRPISNLLAFAILLSLAGCGQSSPTPTPAGQGLSDAERAAVFEKGRANAEKNAKVTRRPRRFRGDSI